ncbi:MAG: ATP-binding protein [Oscillospiraceae bacterium]|nr:ATP-binding protein [Oscillospiraceae bacterium]
MGDLFCDAVNSRFDLSCRTTAFESGAEYLRDWMSFVSLCLVCAAVSKLAIAQAAENGDGSPSLPGTSMELEEAVYHLNAYPGVFMPPNDAEEILFAARKYIEDRESAAYVPDREISRLVRIGEMLSHFGKFAFFCAAACAADRGFERAFIALHGGEDSPFPSLGSVRDLFSLAFPDKEPDWLTDQSSLENRLIFTPAPQDKPGLMRPLSLRPGAQSYALGGQYISRGITLYCDVIDGSGEKENALFADRQLGAAKAALHKLRLRTQPRLCILSGERGSGKKLTLQLLAYEESVRFILLNLDALPESAVLEDLADELLSLALLDGFCLAVQTQSREPDARAERLLTLIKPYKLGVFLLMGAVRANIAPEGYLITRVKYPELDLEQSISFWKEFSAGDGLGGLDCTQLASKYRLTPGKIKSVLQTAADMAENQNMPISEKLISEAVLHSNTGRLSEIADRIEAFYTWGDLILGEASKQQLRDVCDRITYRHLVESEWGFARKSTYGNGISILLYGPPGTGKTMSAQVIAGELGLPLYRINLAQIISKYIGETAKNLDTVFSEAKSSNVILFFDEADALFAKRTDVKNSNDRHANSESSYLLQKIEEYSGVSILATNLANNFDEAFRRRIHYMIHINMPGPARRLELWNSFIPPEAPLAPEVDLRVFAENLEISGSVIKSAVLQAAYFAASENKEIGMAHFAKAIRRELQKLGKSEPHILSSI